MFGSVNKHVKITHTQHDVTNHGSSLSQKQQFICRWTQSHLVEVRRDIPASRSKHAICFYGDNVYLYGGQYGSIGYRDLWRYSVAQNQWEILHGTGEHPSLLQSHTLVANEDRLYVFGGNFSIDPETPLWIFHLDSLRWRKHATYSEVMTPCSRRGHTAVVSHGAMHIFGGYVDLKGSNSELWTFDFATDGWHLAYSAERGKSGPSARHGHSSVVYGGVMWVFGGMMNLEARSDFWCWNFESQVWRRVRGQRGVPELCGHSACVVADSMLVFGGCTEGELQNDVWRFHFGTSSWQRVRCEGVPPSPCHYHSVVVFHHQVSPPADRSHSAPHVGRSHCALLDPQTQQLRPNSSPASIPTPHGTVPFQNQVQPCNDTTALSSSQEKCQFEMFDVRHARTEHPPLDATRVSCPLCAATGTLYQLRKSWSVDFGACTGLRVRKVSEAQPLIRSSKYTLNENMSLSYFGGSVNPVYDESPPYRSVDQFLCRMTNHEEIPLKKLRPDNAVPLSRKCDSSTAQFLGSTRLYAGDNTSNAGRTKLRNHSKSSSLESLLSRFNGAEIGGAGSHITCRSVMQNDLVIEDIEETSFNCSDDVTYEIDMSPKITDHATQSQELGHFNCGATISNDTIKCKVSDLGKSLIIVTNSANVDVDPTMKVVRGTDSDVRDSDSVCHSKMAWLLPGNDDGKENIAATNGLGEQEAAVKVTQPSVTVSCDTCHVSASSDEPNSAHWQMSTSGALYQMFVFGGRMDEPQNLPVQPMSVSKLYISTMLV